MSIFVAKIIDNGKKIKKPKDTYMSRFVAKLGDH